MRMTTKVAGRALCAALLAGSLGACGDFISDVPENTNLVTDASAAQLFTSIQVNTFFTNESQLSRITAMWLNQMAGTDRQFATIDQYTIDEEDADGEMSGLYIGGGLQDIKIARQLTQDQGFTHFNAILKIHEAFLFGMGASIWGDLPYRNAGGGVGGTPLATLDPQEQIYADVQTLLDQAITQLSGAANPGETGLLSSRDVNFGGDAAQWRAVAYSLKARLYMHWVEAQAAGRASATTACAGNCLTKALAAAQNGISSAGGNWNGVHTSTSTETNIWYQFVNDRSGYISGGALLINFLNARSDPRRELYFTTSGGTYAGSQPGTGAPGDPGTNASQLNTSSGGYADPAAELPIITCAETYFIIAEAQYRLGAEPAARAATRAGVACHLAQLGLASDAAAVDAALGGGAAFNALTGAALLAEIIRQKYIALFLNMEAYNDYKRTCLPNLTPIKAGTNLQGEPVPDRLFYGQTERQANPENIPTPQEQQSANGGRNENDPASCPA